MAGPQASARGSSTLPFSPPSWTAFFGLRLSRRCLGGYVCKSAYASGIVLVLVVAAGAPEGLFRVVYRFENEQLLEVQNRTVHAAALSALVERAMAIDFTLRSTCARAHGLHRSTWG